MLGQLLHLHGIDSVILEKRSRQYVIERVRAGVLEQGTVDLMRDVGVGERLAREGLRHDGIYLAFGGTRHRIDMAELTGGRAITIYGQNEVVHDLIEARLATGRPLHFEVEDVSVHDLDSGTPSDPLSRRTASSTRSACDFIAGCDGFHGICRPSIPASRLRIYERAYPFGWLGILAEARAVVRRAGLQPARARLRALQHALAAGHAALPAVRARRRRRRDGATTASGPSSRTRLATDDGWRPNEGPIFQKGVTGMRSFVVEPMRFGRLFLAGDAAHIVPPTGAKGLNLAMADVYRLATRWRSSTGRAASTCSIVYSERALRRTWRAQRFSWWMTSMLHRSDSDNPFDHRRQLAELEYLVSSRAAMTSLAESYTGTPFDA